MKITCSECEHIWFDEEHPEQCPNCGKEDDECDFHFEEEQECNLRWKTDEEIKRDDKVGKQEQ